MCSTTSSSLYGHSSRVQGYIICKYFAAAALLSPPVSARRNYHKSISARNNYGVDPHGVVTAVYGVSLCFFLRLSSCSVVHTQQYDTHIIWYIPFSFFSSSRRTTSAVQHVYVFVVLFESCVSDGTAVCVAYNFSRLLFFRFCFFRFF